MGLKNTLLLCMVVAVQFCASAGEKSVEGRGYVDQRKILGYTQFQVWSKEPMLGYAPDLEDPSVLRDLYLEPIKVRNGEGMQTIEITYSAETLAQAKVQLEKIATVKAGLEDVVSATFRFVNPSEHVLEDFKPSAKALRDPDAAGKRKYIAAALKVKRIEITLKTKGGAEIKTEAELKKQNIQFDSGMKYDSSQNALYSGEDRFVGFKLLTIPKNLQ